MALFRRSIFYFSKSPKPYWFTVRPLKGEEEGTDRWAFAQRLVSITPLRLDLTDEKDLTRVLALDPPPAPGKKLPSAAGKNRKRAPRKKAA